MEQEKMTPAQALEILDKVAADFSGNRAAHQTLITALQTINEVISVPAQAEPVAAPEAVVTPISK